MALAKKWGKAQLGGLWRQGFQLWRCRCGLQYGSYFYKHYLGANGLAILYIVWDTI